MKGWPGHKPRPFKMELAHAQAFRGGPQHLLELSFKKDHLSRHKHTQSQQSYSGIER